MNRRKIVSIVIMLIILLIFLILLLVSITNNKSNGKIENDEAFEYTEESTKNTNDIYQLQYPNIAMYAYEVINNLGYNSYSDEVMFNILDEEYIEYYNISMDNISEMTAKYKDKRYEIENIEYASTYDNEMYILFVKCKTGEIFIIKYSDISKKYKLYLDDYIEEMGYDQFINNNLIEILNNSYVQGNNYNIIENLAYSPNSIVDTYQKMLSEYDFEYIYNNYISDNTKQRYTYEYLTDFYNNENTFFMNNEVSDVDYTINDNGFRIYTFKDYNLNKYTLTENSYFNFLLDIEASEY